MKFTVSDYELVWLHDHEVPWPTMVALVNHDGTWLTMVTHSLRPSWSWTIKNHYAI